MAWKPSYCTTAELKAWLAIGDTADDTLLARCITDASRAVDTYCGRQFGSASQVRYYTFDCALLIDECYAVRIDDVQTTVGLTVAYDELDNATWSRTTTLGTDWNLWPYNAPSDGKPWTHLLQRPPGTYQFPYSRQGVKVTATFGWTAVPDAVAQACLILAARFFVRKDAAFGVAGSPDLGNSTQLQQGTDSDVLASLSSYRRQWGAA